MSDATKSVFLHIMQSLAYAFILFVVSFIGNLVFSDHGAVKISKDIKIDDRLYSIITIENYESNSLNNLRFYIKGKLELSDISSKPFASISLDGKNTEHTLIEISDVAPNRTTNILLNQGGNNIEIMPLNLNQKSIRARTDEQNPWSFLETVILAGAVSLLVGVITLISSLYEHKKRSELKEKLDSVEKELDRAASRAKSVDLELAEIKQASMRIRILLIARISDYIKELNFWRDTIRKILTTPDGKVSPEKVIDLVTDTLGTYGTKGKAAQEEPDLLKYLQSLVWPNKEKHD
jgi:hypothetical protein